jgi:hypothetical protein
MNDADRVLARLAEAQRQVFTRTQARTAGLSASDVAYRLSTGLFAACGPHTLRFAGTNLDYRGRLQAGLLDLGPEALVAGRSAAALHQLDGFGEGPLEYLVLRSIRNRRTPGVVMSTPAFEPLDRVIVDGLPTCSPTLTIVQLLGRADPAEVGNALDSATRRRLTAPSVVHRRLERLGRRGRRGVRDFDGVMQSAGVESWLERRFLSAIRRAGLPQPLLQRVYQRNGQHVARVDFDFAPAPLLVEVGGRRGYLSATERRRQEHRRNQLQLLGKTVYFFSTEDVQCDEDYVLTTVRSALGLAA